jgi:hypothetical protein
MGRLTLNVLLSFAQFEREVTGERIRDKIAASKRKGMWMGGVPPLGYDLPTDPLTRALVVNADEAETVRLIFQRYLELGSVHAVMRWLDDQAIRSKARITAKGRAMGGRPFERGALFHLLKNRVYLGDIMHKGQRCSGAHPPIVDSAKFDEVQERLSSQARRFRARPSRVSTMMLKGLVFDADGAPMSPTFGHGKRGQVYRYYVSGPLQQGSRRDAVDDLIRRVPAHAIEALVQERLDRLSAGRSLDVRALVARVEVQATTVQLIIRRSAFFKRPSEPQSELEVLAGRLPAGDRMTHHREDERLARLTLPCRLKFGAGRVWITDANGAGNLANTAPDKTLIRALQSAHRLIARSADQRIGRPEDLATGRLPKSPYERNLCRLAFLAPDIQAAILEGRQPYDLTSARFFQQDIPPAWADQRRAFGFPC